MSIVALSHVMKHSEAKLGARLVLFVLAEHAHDDGSNAFPAVATLMERTRMSRRGVQAALRTLEEDGMIRRDLEQPTMPAGQSKWVLDLSVPEGGAQNPRGAQNPHGGGAATSPEPTTNPPSLSLPGVGAEIQAAPAVAVVKYRGKKVPPGLTDRAVRVLAVFAFATERKASPFTGHGEPTPMLKQVIGAMIARPDVTEEEWAAAVRNTVANPPDWVEDKVMIGHVFGEKAAEWALTNSGVPPAAKRKGDPGRQETGDKFLAALAKFNGEGVALHAG